jgi:NO-binding membrane sensor protein with MHYT domain
MGYSTGLLAASVLIAIVAGTAALWAALRLGTLRHTLLASLIMGVAVSGMHYTGMAAMQLRAAPGGGMAAMGGGASAEAFLLPLILGITVLTFLVTAIVTLAPTEAEIREDAALMERIAQLTERVERPSPLSTGRRQRAEGMPIACSVN